MSKLLHGIYISIICILAIILWFARAHLDELNVALSLAVQEIATLQEVPKPQPLDPDQRRLQNLEALLYELQEENRAFAHMLTRRELEQTSDEVESEEFYLEEEDWEPGAQEEVVIEQSHGKPR